MVSKQQVRITTDVVRWYLARHFGTGTDPGLPRAFCDPRRLGLFAADYSEFARGQPKALFRVLIAMIMFQRRQDVQITRVLKQMDPSIAREVRSAFRLLTLVDSAGCENTRDSGLLLSACDLHKAEGRGTCKTNPTAACHLKRHTVALKRYGHFGKFPTSAALMLRESGWRDLGELRSAVLAADPSPTNRALALEAALSRIWRVSDKIAAMFLSAVTNPDLGPAPWQEGVDWRYFVVVDSNVDLFLARLGYCGQGTYSARRSFIIEVSRRIDLSAINATVQAFNPRLVQQAMFLFMSVSNRRSIAADCMHEESACTACPKQLRVLCQVASKH